MAYNWQINSMSCYPEADGQTDVVFKVFFSVQQQATVNGLPFLGAVNGNVDVTYEAGSPYTPYDQLTQAQVLGWVQSVLGVKGVEEYETAVAAQISAAQTPPVVQPPLPWSA